MNGSDFGNLLKSYPWDISRRIYANPSISPACHVSGVSFDWEFLISSSFVDCKVLIQDWLVSRRSLLRPEDDTYSDLQIPSIDAEFKRRVLARTVLYEDSKFYDIIAMAYLYFAGIYGEETELLAAFSAQRQLVDSRTENEQTTTNSGSDLASIRFPDLPTLVRWLKECVEDVHSSAPAWAGGLARSSRTGVKQAAPGVSTARSAAGIPHSIYDDLEVDQGVKEEVGGKRRREESEEAVRHQKCQERVISNEEEEVNDEERRERHARGEMEFFMQQQAHMQMQQRQFHQQQHHHHLLQQHQHQHQVRPFPSGPPNYAPARPFLTTNTAVYVNATHKGTAQAQAQGRHAPPPLNQPFPSLYRQAPGALPSSHTLPGEVPAWLAPFSSGMEHLGVAIPREGAFNYRAQNSHIPLGPTGLSAEEVQFASQFSQERPPFAGSSIYSTHPAAGVMSVTRNNSHEHSHSSLNTMGGPSARMPNTTMKQEQGKDPQKQSTQFSVPYVGPLGSGEGTFGKELLGPAGMPKSLPSTTAVARPPAHAPLQHQQFNPAVVAAGSVATTNMTIHSHSGSNGSAMNSNSAINPMSYFPHGALTQQLIAPQKQFVGHQANQLIAVNRRQKKNRDKFKVTFLVSRARAEELQRLHGILPDQPSSNQIGNILHPPSTTTTNSKSAATNTDHATNTAGKAVGSKEKDKQVAFSVLIPLKGIDVLPNGRYRVQLNTFMSGRKKFSRNSTDLYEALWIFEIALLISDSPTLLSELQRIGNFNCLAPLGHLGFFSSPREYYLELGRHILLFYDTVDFFSEDLLAVAIKNYDAMRPTGAMPPGAKNLQQQLQQKQNQGQGQIQAGGALVTVVSAERTVAAEKLSVGAAQSSDASSVEGGEGGEGGDSGSDSEEDDERIYNALLSPPPIPAIPSVNANTSQSKSTEESSNLINNNKNNNKSINHHHNNKISRVEEEVVLPWMGGFAFGLCLLEQQLSCLYCARTVPVPKHLPVISMVKEEKFTAAQIHQLQQQGSAAVPPALAPHTANGNSSGSGSSSRGTSGNGSAVRSGGGSGSGQGSEKGSKTLSSVPSLSLLNPSKLT